MSASVTPMRPLLEVKALHMHFPITEGLMVRRSVGDVKAVDGVDFNVRKGETLGIVAFVTVSLGGFGSIPGALIAGLLIGVIESLSAYLIGAVYKDMVVYSLFLGFLWFRPQGLMGKA